MRCLIEEPIHPEIASFSSSPAAGVRGRIRPRPQSVLAVGLPEPDSVDARRGEADALGQAVLPKLPGARRPLLVGGRRELRPRLRRRRRARLPARRHRDHLQDQEQVPPEHRSGTGGRVV